MEIQLMQVWVAAMCKKDMERLRNIDITSQEILRLSRADIENNISQ